VGSWQDRDLLWPSTSAALIFLNDECGTEGCAGVVPGNPGQEDDNGMLRAEKTTDEKLGDTCSPGEQSG
jgi:hypothetical protein